MKQTDYVRMAEKCAREADRLPPGPERDELLKKIKLFESYAKIENGLHRRACSRQIRSWLWDRGCSLQYCRYDARPNQVSQHRIGASALTLRGVMARIWKIPSARHGAFPD